MLAGKKSIADRNMEHNLNRAAYNTIDNLQKLIARNMIGFNVGSWLTNFLPIVQGGAGIGTQNMIKAAHDTVVNYYSDDGFANRSTFLTNRKGTKRLTETTLEKLASAGMKPMELIDDFSSQIVTRGKYLDEIQRGTSPAEAMKKADAYAAGVIADRSKGALPTAFNKKNIISKLFTMFQVEANNQYGFLFKDLPRETKEKGTARLAGSYMKFMIGSYLFAELFKAVAGREPNPNPIGTVKRMIEADSPSEALKVAGTEIAQNTPFIGGIAGGGRYPIQAALPDFQKMGETINDIADNGITWGKAGQLAWDTAKNPLTYLASPIGGGGQAKKTYEGIRAFNQGASLTDTGKMRYPIEQTPSNAIKTGLFGQYSTGEARDYFDGGNKPLSEKQTAAAMQSEDPQASFERFVQQIEIDKLLQDIKDTAKDDTLTRADKDKKILQLRAKINEMRAAGR
jgi:hypothetical protein